MASDNGDGTVAVVMVRRIKANEEKENMKLHCQEHKKGVADIAFNSVTEGSAVLA